MGYNVYITCVPLPRRLVYFGAVMDRFSRSVLAWELSKSVDGNFCQTTLQQALQARHAPAPAVLGIAPSVLVCEASGYTAPPAPVTTCYHL